jgi:hypothetical protein
LRRQRREPRILAVGTLPSQLCLDLVQRGPTRTRTVDAARLETIFSCQVIPRVIARQRNPSHARLGSSYRFRWTSNYEANPVTPVTCGVVITRIGRSQSSPRRLRSLMQTSPSRIVGTMKSPLRLAYSSMRPRSTVIRQVALPTSSLGVTIARRDPRPCTGESRPLDELTATLLFPSMGLKTGRPPLFIRICRHTAYAVRRTACVASTRADSYVGLNHLLRLILDARGVYVMPEACRLRVRLCESSRPLCPRRWT